MDCYIVRVYRHVTRNNGQTDEIAGLVERVGNQDSGKPFSTYGDLVKAIREGFQTEPPEEQEADSATTGSISVIHSVRGR